MQGVKVFDSYTLTNRKLPINYHEMIERETIVLKYFKFGETTLYNIKKAYVTPFGVVIHKHKIVKESLCDYNANINNINTYIKKRVLRKVKKSNGQVVVFFNPFYINYYHFIAECITRLLSVYDKKEHVQPIVLSSSPKYVFSFLELLGYKNIITIEEDEILYCEDIILPSQTTVVHKQNPHIINLLSKILRKNVETIKHKFSDFKNIYISREKAIYRKVLNETDLLNAISRYDFKIVNFEDYSLLDCIAIMSNADCLLGVHGAGLTNMIFMDSQKLIIHLIHEGHHDPSFYNLATAMQHDSIFIQGRGEYADPRGVCYDSFFVDIPKVLEYLEENLLQQLPN